LQWVLTAHGGCGPRWSGARRLLLDGSRDQDQFIDLRADLFHVRIGEGIVERGHSIGIVAGAVDGARESGGGDFSIRAGGSLGNGEVEVHVTPIEGHAHGRRLARIDGVHGIDLLGVERDDDIDEGFQTEQLLPQRLGEEGVPVGGVVGAKGYGLILGVIPGF
jgi:hypothetical protein